jgi:hypothetical protein
VSGDDRLRLVLILLFIAMAAAVLGGPVALMYALVACAALAFLLLTAVVVRRLRKGGAVRLDTSLSHYELDKDGA